MIIDKNMVYIAMQMIIKPGMYMAVLLEVGYNKIGIIPYDSGIKVWNGNSGMCTGCIDFGNKFEI